MSRYFVPDKIVTLILHFLENIKRLFSFFIIDFQERANDFERSCLGADDMTETKLASSKILKIKQGVLLSLPLWYRCQALVLAKNGMVKIISDDDE